MGKVEDKDCNQTVNESHNIESLLDTSEWRLLSCLIIILNTLECLFILVCLSIITGITSESTLRYNNDNCVGYFLMTLIN